jgi:hypothetical protein
MKRNRKCGGEMIRKKAASALSGGEKRRENGEERKRREMKESSYRRSSYIGENGIGEAYENQSKREMAKSINGSIEEMAYQRRGVIYLDGNISWRNGGENNIWHGEKQRK